ncbi:MAG TPA: FAD-binding protein, partial [Longimicrobiales bacterium]|nr:FAD-binding protein [Longimicrobiales bacterium]
LADIDITKQPMEVGPTTHYAMGGIRVDAETQMSTLPGLFAAGECAAGLHGANRLGGNSLSDLLVFGQRAGEHAARFARENGAERVGEREVDDVARYALAPFDRGTHADTAPSAEGPYAIQYALQALMQEKVGIIRTAEEIERALEEIAALRQRADRVAVPGNREYNPGWHTALDLHNLLTVAEAVARAALERTESRGAHTREDHPDKDPAWSGSNLVVSRGPTGEMRIARAPIPALPDELKRIIEEQG